MTIQEYIESVRRRVWEATADTNGPSNGLNLTVHLDEHGEVTQERERACTVELSVFYSEAWASQARE